MKTSRRSLTLLAMALLCVLTFCVKASQAGAESKIRHFVAFAFKDSASPEQIDSVVKAFLELRKTVPEVQSIEAGPNNSPEHLNKGLTHAFLVTFASEKDRDTYLTHPEHEKFKKFALPFVSDALVIDFSGKK
jgi:hypothetical protein